MAPLESGNHDQAFLTLLSSQRQLLNQLSKENAVKKEQQSMPTMIPPARKRNSILGAIEPLSLMNRPIDRRGSLDMLMSRRMSSIGMPSNSFYNPGFENNDWGFPKGSELESSFDQEHWNMPSQKMQRRRSSLAILSSLLFEDQGHPQSRRFSMLSVLSQPNDTHDSFEAELLAFEKRDSNSKQSLDAMAVKKALEAFTVAMDRTQKSQQDIHDWDRKMGLKRSHSKTMRLTMRSRKKLRSMLKKDINHLVNAAL